MKKIKFLSPVEVEQYYQNRKEDNRDSLNKLAEYVKDKVGIIELLKFYKISTEGYPGNIRCPFHDDRKPSASVIENKVLHCHSGCGSFGIIKIVQIKEKLKNIGEVIAFLVEKFNIDVSMEKLGEIAGGEKSKYSIKAEWKREIKYWFQVVVDVLDELKSNYRKSGLNESLMMCCDNQDILWGEFNTEVFGEFKKGNDACLDNLCDWLGRVCSYVEKERKWLKRDMMELDDDLSFREM